MKKDFFYAELIQALNIKDEIINEDSLLYLDSLATLSIIAFVDEKFNQEIDTDKLTYIIKVRDLMNLIGTDKFE